MFKGNFLSCLGVEGERTSHSYVTVFLLDSKLACHIPISVFLTFLSIMQLTAHKYPNEIFDIETQS